MQGDMNIYTQLTLPSLQFGLLLAFDHFTPQSIFLVLYHQMQWIISITQLVNICYSLKGVMFWPPFICFVLLCLFMNRITREVKGWIFIMKYWGRGRLWTAEEMIEFWKWPGTYSGNQAVVNASRLRLHGFANRTTGHISDCTDSMQ